ncbi:uncharacterized protein BT62DRAFT_923891 [Guyanagaster necrorhizus]|uniref:Uncharacterized protein n=1 Tax=Guyanagaster necrorhizus TaxID=856835 RepID=A0A9P7VGR8_9AGAR|nr:uncharacterized protein BT62DRAFT_923891 [Guyanagaster necrorhizus MCA 3950]KAG7440713.1 hypothetical protein BT62DRAFT_923891 [Guyanagaster necrorhizus MCA 3950]
MKIDLWMNWSIAQRQSNVQLVTFKSDLVECVRVQEQEVRAQLGYMPTDWLLLSGSWIMGPTFIGRSGVRVQELGCGRSTARSAVLVTIHPVGKRNGRTTLEEQLPSTNSTGWEMRCCNMSFVILQNQITSDVSQEHRTLSFDDTTIAVDFFLIIATFFCT